MYLYMYVCMNSDDNKQEVLELKLSNIFSFQCTLNKIYLEYFLEDPVFKLVAIQKFINKIFEKQLQRKQSR